MEIIGFALNCRQPLPPEGADYNSDRTSEHTLPIPDVARHGEKSLGNTGPELVSSCNVQITMLMDLPPIGRIGVAAKEQQKYHL